jgi:membrane associated rhomboid family serine protease
LLVQPSPFGGDGDVHFLYRHAAIPAEVVDGQPLTTCEVFESAGDARAPAVCESAVADVAYAPGKHVWLAVLTSLFLHGNVLHVSANLLFLWVFGNNVEDRLGHVRFLFLYLCAGVVATLAHVIVDPSATVPIIGASGAIAGVMGAYLVWWPHARIYTLLFFFLAFIVRVPAAVLLVVWFGLQFFTNQTSSVAWVAHVGGFVFGVVAGLVVNLVAGRPRALAERPAPG